MLPRFPLLLSLAILFGEVAPAAAAGAVRGTLWMNRKGPAAAKTLSPPAVIARHQAGVTDAVVYVEKIPDAVQRKLAGRGGFAFFRSKPKVHVARMVQKNRLFQPRVVAVPAGTRVEFVNLDRVYHSAFSVSAARRFDLGKYPPGRADTVLFETAGVINLHSDIYPEMLGYLVVTPNHAYVRPDSLGRYALPRLPAGSYTIRVWHPRRGEIKRAVTVPRRGDLALDLSF